jgi:hypothetical protein
MRSKVVTSFKSQSAQGNITTHDGALFHRLPSGAKQTPPLVGMIPVLLAVVSLQSPNHGHTFFACSQSRSFGMIQCDAAFLLETVTLSLPVTTANH